MKRLFYLAAFLLLAGATYAQQPTLPAGTGNYTGKIIDSTFANANTYSRVLQIVGKKQVLNFQYIITKNSGTVGGSIVLQGTLDGGTTWPTINSYTVTDATANGYYTILAPGFNKYRLLITTTGTMNANIKVYTLYRED